MVQGYYAYACLTIRRLTDKQRPNPPKKGDPKLVTTLVVLLEDLRINNHLLTRSRQRRIYKRHMKHLHPAVYIGAVDRTFNYVARDEPGERISRRRIRKEGLRVF